jgi:hypothetical protein
MLSSTSIAPFVLVEKRRIQNLDLIQDCCQIGALLVAALTSTIQCEHAKT